MIGVFARMFGSKERVMEVSELDGDGGYQVKAGASPSAARDATVPNEVPPGFVETVETDGGDVHMSPFVDALRAWLKRQRDEEDAAGAEAEAGAPDAAEADGSGS